MQIAKHNAEGALLILDHFKDKESAKASWTILADHLHPLSDTEIIASLSGPLEERVKRSEGKRLIKLVALGFLFGLSSSAIRDIFNQIAGS